MSAPKDEAVVTSVEPYLEELLRPPLSELARLSADEVAWLRSLPGLVWFNLKPSAGVLLAIVKAYRLSQAEGRS